MLTASRLAASLLLLLTLLCLPLLAQEKAAESRSAPIVTATATAKGLRLTAPSNTTAVRLEVYTADGQRLFDSGFKSGTLLDWTMLDEGGQRYPAGTYLCVVAVKSLSGRVSQKLGTLSISAERAFSLSPTEATQLSVPQRQALSGAENSSALTVLREGEATAVTALANTGTEGEITRGRGALSFRLGDFYGGKDVEQMRLTREGNLGIGTANPQARLDVNGVIRAREGIQFNDGTLLNLSPQGGLSVTSPGGQASSLNATTNNLSGTGTQNRLPKWTDGSGTLGDSKIFEDASGNVGIGTDTPGNKLTVAGSVELGSTGAGAVGVNPTITNPSRTAGFAQVQFYPASGSNVSQSFSVVPRGTGQANNRAQFTIFNTDFIANNQAYEFLTMRARGNDFVVGTGKVGTGVIRPIIFSAGLMTDNVTNNNQLVLAADGSVGVGTNAPTQKLEVNGRIKLAGQGNAIYFPDGTKQITAGGGGQMTGTSIVTALNDPETTGTINDNRLSDNVARLNTANTFNGNQTVNGSVGIGTASPQYKLHVVGQDVRVEGDTPTTFPRFSWNFTGGAAQEKKWQVYAAPRSLNFSALDDSEAYELLWLRVNRGGVGFNGVHFLPNYAYPKVGIGAMQAGSPQYSLHVSGTNIRLESNYAGVPEFPRFSLNYVHAGADEKKWQYYATANSLNFSALNDAENADNIWLSVKRTGTAINSVVFPAGDVGIGTTATPQAKLDIVSSTVSSPTLRVQTTSPGGTVASFGDKGAFQIDSSGIPGGRLNVRENGSVIIGDCCNNTSVNDRLAVFGTVSIWTLGSAGSRAVCLNGSGQISACSSSIRYKTNVADLSSGLNLINRLRPVTFDWKASREHDLGLVAEEVAEVEPLLVVHNQQGEIEGVKYDRLNVVLVNAVKEQQAQIKSQADALAALQKENLEMKRRLASLEQSLRGRSSGSSLHTRPAPRGSLRAYLSHSARKRRA